MSLHEELLDLDSAVRQLSQGVNALGLAGLRAGQMLMMQVPNLGDINLSQLVLLEKVTHTF